MNPPSLVTSLLFLIGKFQIESEWSSDFERDKGLTSQVALPADKAKDLPAYPHHRLLLGLDVHLDWDGCRCFLLKKCIVISGSSFLVGIGADNSGSAWPCEQMLLVKYNRSPSALGKLLLELPQPFSPPYKEQMSFQKLWTTYRALISLDLFFRYQDSNPHQPLSFWRQESQRE